MMNALMVFIGGGIGSCLRYGISLWIPTKTNGFPISTFLANLLSCFLIGLLIGFLTRSQINEIQRMLLITGFCGGFSTFSTFSAEIYQLLKVGYYGVTIAYIALSIIFGVALVFGGLFVSGGIK